MKYLPYQTMLSFMATQYSGALIEFIRNRCRNLKEVTLFTFRKNTNNSGYVHETLVANEDFNLDLFNDPLVISAEAVLEYGGCCFNFLLCNPSSEFAEVVSPQQLIIDIDRIVKKHNNNNIEAFLDDLEKTIKSISLKPEVQDSSMEYVGQTKKADYKQNRRGPYQTKTAGKNVSPSRLFQSMFHT